LERLASFSRLIMFDKRGVGMSDPAAGDRLPTLEERLDDVRAVLDAAGSKQAVLFGTSEGGALATMLATTEPGRAMGVVIFSSFARLSFDESDYPHGLREADSEASIAYAREHWGKPEIVDAVLPSLKDDEAARRWWAGFFRRSVSPGAIATQFRMNRGTDVTSLLPLVQAPTLVMHGRDELFLAAAHGRYMAERIPGARWVELPTADHLLFAEAGPMVAAEVEEFLTGVREPTEPDRMLATVLFTDVVDSTARTSSEGDARWRELLDDHDRLVRRELERYRGREVKNTGDGFLAAFDGPARAIRCGRSICERAAGLGLELRAGIHTGEVEVRGDDIGGIAVHIAARVMDKAQPGEVLVSRTLTDLVAGSDLRFEDRGEHELKGVAQKWQLFAARA
jgi:class 3 adenylate cyclase